MVSRSVHAIAALLLVSCSTAAPPSRDPFGPSLESARQNAPQIFNAIHNAMRQFGSSLHHNGMSFFPATIPAGTMLYHGATTPKIPDTLEWLAFEVEHAENFARGYRRPNQTRGFAQSQENGQRPLQNWAHSEKEEYVTFRSSSMAHVFDDGWHGNEPAWEPGYFHIYQAVRPLNVLYLDGMAAGKTNMGTNDAEDFILSSNKSRGGYEDYIRAADLCTWSKQWGVDGLIRMEPGFEVIYCDFHDGGLLQVAANRRGPIDGSKEYLIFKMFEWIQAASKRYRGIGGNRVQVDYSSMVSAFFYPVNLTNPNATRSEHPRLVFATESELAAIKGHVERTVIRSWEGVKSAVDWQGVTDMIVTRYSDRLSLMAATKSIKDMKLLLSHLLDGYIHRQDDGFDLHAAQQRCRRHYLDGFAPVTPEENLMHAGIDSTAKLICETLFEAHALVVENPSADESSVQTAVRMAQDLMDTLRWPEWKLCGACQVDEVCFVAMWPFGNVEDHYSPSCQNATTAFARNSYWRYNW
ncbi:hypothetical protein JX266_000465 [Neoarthrinium moseri]|uniref:uncharacterized protein n=1 Tax=Neoarthrinium moseri TaxID=1658444 RepID=UPI001FDDBB47|nr:uncharacterized protein JN550_004222 [Neoarthrinium moseri]KAI1855600.1 hypothetical protein JX266_000465 [Neoarthrinium moseri]KAI1872019.1 hypothetical protein JN550_004222 [Neoarthrinium moseri]